MNNTPSCQNCAFYFSKDKLCRRFPAQVVSWANPKPTNNDDEIIIRTQFPIMLPEGWCGEWQRRLQ